MGKIGFVYKIEKIEPVGETICEQGVDIRGLCQSMHNEGVNISREFTDRKYLIMA